MITFFARLADGTTIPWNYGYPVNPPSVSGGQFDFNDGMDFTAVLNHEIGHALGLRSHDGTARATMGGNGCPVFFDWDNGRFGPNSSDSARLRSLFGVDTAPRIRQFRSIDDGVSWQPISNALESSALITTSADFSAVRDGVSTVAIAWRDPTTLKPMFMTGNETFSARDTPQEIDSATPAQGGVGMAGRGDEFMVAWLDTTTDSMRLRVRHTVDASTWVTRDPPNGFTESNTFPRGVGTPGVASDSSGNWYIGYGVLDEVYPSRSGTVVVIKSANDGVTWSPETLVASPATDRTTYGVDVAIITTSPYTRLGTIFPIKHPYVGDSSKIWYAQSTLDPSPIVGGSAASMPSSVSRAAGGTNVNGVVTVAYRTPDDRIAVIMRSSSTGALTGQTFAEPSLFIRSPSAVATRSTGSSMYLYYFRE